jgi:hypothetical protein
MDRRESTIECIHQGKAVQLNGNLLWGSVLGYVIWVNQENENCLVSGVNQFLTEHYFSSKELRL